MLEKTAPLFLVLFVGLKLTNHIDWNWIYVLSPIWICILVIVLYALFKK